MWVQDVKKLKTSKLEERDIKATTIIMILGQISGLA